MAAATMLAVVLAGSALFVDSGAQASFDAPKRLVALLGLALAAAAAFARAPRAAAGWNFGQSPGLARLSAWLLAAGLAWAVLSGLLSPRREASLDALRATLVGAVALPLGASRVVGRKGRLLLAVFVAALALDAGVSIAQSRGLYRPFQLTTVGLRDDTGAFAGNVGYLSIALSLALTACVGLILHAKSLPTRSAAAVFGVLFVWDLAVNRNLTAILAAGAGALVLLVLRFGRRFAIPLVAAAALSALLAYEYRPMRLRLHLAIRAAQAGDWDRLLTYRGGPWVAALEMARERPVLGFGPGTFGPEFVPHRLAAEIRWRRRFVNPLVTSSYGETHCDYLQPFAEIGVPGALALLSAAALLAVALGTRLRRSPGESGAESALLAALLTAGAAAALLWFPLQRPITAVPLLLVAGRAWRVCADGVDPENREPAAHSPAPESAGWKRFVPRLALVAVLALAAWPEIPRYGAERRLRLLEGALTMVVQHPSEISDAPGALNRIADLAGQTAGALPADPRPLLLAGGARLINGEGDAAVALYRSAIALGERAETDMNLGRACDALARPGEAAAWCLRGGWVSPPLLYALLPDLAAPARAEIRRLEAELSAGRLASPPPLPP